MDSEDLPVGLLEADDPDYSASPAGEGEVSDPETEHRPASTIVVIVFAPKETEPRRFRFRVEDTVGDAAKVAAKAFGYEGGSPSFQKEDGKVLDRKLTLRAAGVRDHEKLELVDAGGGV